MVLKLIVISSNRQFTNVAGLIGNEFFSHIFGFKRQINTH